jgi:hypothetical protein
LPSSGILKCYRPHGLRYYPFTLGFHPTATEHVDEIAAVGTRFLLIQLSIEYRQRMLDGEPALQNARSPQ